MALCSLCTVLCGRVCRAVWPCAPCCVAVCTVLCGRVHRAVWPCAPCCVAVCAVLCGRVCRAVWPCVPCCVAVCAVAVRTHKLPTVCTYAIHICTYVRTYMDRVWMMCACTDFTVPSQTCGCRCQRYKCLSWNSGV